MPSRTRGRVRTQRGTRSSCARCCSSRGVSMRPPRGARRRSQSLTATRPPSPGSRRSRRRGATPTRLLPCMRRRWSANRPSSTLSPSATCTPRRNGPTNPRRSSRSCGRSSSSTPRTASAPTSGSGCSSPTMTCGSTRRSRKRARRTKRGPASTQRMRRPGRSTSPAATRRRAGTRTRRCDWARRTRCCCTTPDGSARLPATSRVRGRLCARRWRSTRAAPCSTG